MFQWASCLSDGVLRTQCLPWPRNGMVRAGAGADLFSRGRHHVEGSASSRPRLVDVGYVFVGGLDRNWSWSCILESTLADTKGRVRTIALNSVPRHRRRRKIGPAGVKSGSGSVVEHLLAKEGVEGSNPFFRSKTLFSPGFVSRTIPVLQICRLFASLVVSAHRCLR